MLYRELPAIGIMNEVEKLLSFISVVTGFHDWFPSFIFLQNSMYLTCCTPQYNVTGTSGLLDL